MSKSEAAQRKLASFDCDGSWEREAPKLPSSGHAHVRCLVSKARKRRRPARSPAKEKALEMEVTNLKRIAARQQKLLDMLLVLVDPEDVRAALRLPRITPPAATWHDWAQNSVPPPELRDIQEEKPW